MPDVHAHEPIEIVLAATGTSTNAYAEVTLDIHLTSPAGEALVAPGFWDGGARWVARVAPDLSGTWRWRSASSDPGLDGRAGSFEVGPPRSASPWRIHGPLTVHGPGRALTHADGTPVFWLADTVWAAPAHATEAEWDRYVRTRAEQGYNVVQINALPQWDASGPPLREPFARRPDGGDDVLRPDPAYFQALERMVARAAEAGLMAAVVILWFDWTPADNEDWAGQVPRRGPFDDRSARLLARHLVARLAAYGACWIVSGDSAFRAAASVALYDAVAATARAAAPRRPVVTAHLNGSTSTSAELNARSWLDLHLFQSCHFLDSPARARRHAEVARAFSPVRPVLNSEPCYDALRVMGPDNEAGVRFGRDAVRRTSWVSILGGATAGITYGAHGLWPWHRGSQAYGAMHYGEPLPWEEALALPSGYDLARLKELLAPLRWWELEPRAAPPAEPSDAALACAATAKGQEMLLYVTRAASLALPEAREGAPKAARWLDPRHAGHGVELATTRNGRLEAASWDGEAILWLSYA